MSPCSLALAARPAFFLVGAPKCGTTALQQYLAQAPDVFMPAGKEFHHFADDLLCWDDPLRDEARYLALFADAAPGQLVGETSVFHLLSTTAAARIQAFAPDARIVVMVRNPLELIPALHAQLVYNGEEPLADLGEALDAEADRARGLRIPAAARFPQKLLYTQVVRFAEQIERYRARFARLHVVVYDDFKRDTAAAVREVLAFLGRDAAFAPEIRVVNANKQVRSRRFQRLLRDADGPLARLARLVPRSTRLRIRALLHGWNTVHRARPPLAPAVRARLRTACALEVEKLGDLIGRDLSPWIEDRP
jgi:hypothetical protein